jgi:hypothetical protein
LEETQLPEEIDIEPVEVDEGPVEVFPEVKVNNLLNDQET